uniref:GIY-YIG domain-containing protein n=1 Tax=viral metagenome TaxID=1070528 RepID=A0A6C0K939_9ZZZZ
MGYIYKITNIISNKCYIGETIQDDALKRFKSHISASRRGSGCPALRDAFKKYGFENFKFDVLIICFDEDRFRYEKEYIKKYNSLVPNGYNIKECGEGPSGFHHTDETKMKISKKISDRMNDPLVMEQNRQRLKTIWKDENKRKEQSARIKTSENHKLSILNRRQTYIHSYETKIKISNTLTGKHAALPAEHKKKISESMCKPILQYDSKNTLIRRFKSTNEATSILNLPKGGISHVLCGKTKTCGGFIWKFE